MFSGLCLALALAQAPAPSPTVVVLLSRNLGASPATVAKLLAHVQHSLTEGGVRVLSDEQAAALLSREGQKNALHCEGRSRCLVDLARALRVDVLVSLSLSYVKPDVSVLVEALRAADGSQLSEVVQVLDKDDPPTALQVADFVRSLKAALAPPPAVVVVTPPPKQPDAPVLTVAPPLVPKATRRSAAPAVVTGIAAAAALGTGVAFGVSAGAAGGALAGRDGPFSRLSYSEAELKRDEANTQLGVAVGCAVGAAVLGVVTLILWPSEGLP